MTDKKLAECVFDLTTIAYSVAKKAGEKADDIDSRAIFGEVWSLAQEFENGYRDEGEYMTDIEEFGLARFNEWFGVETPETTGPEMTEDTRRAVEVLSPLFRELHIKANADKFHLTLNGQVIGIDMNSTWATIMEAIGYLFSEEYLYEFRRVDDDAVKKVKEAIKRYWRKEK